MPYVSERQKRHNEAEITFRALMVGVAELDFAPGEVFRAWPTYNGQHGYAFHPTGLDMAQSDSVGVALVFIGVTPMVAWAPRYVRSIKTAYGSISLKKATPAGLLDAWRACLVAHRAAQAEERVRIREAIDLQAEAKAVLGFWRPTIEEHEGLYNHFSAALRTFPFEDLSVRRDNGSLRFYIKPKALNNLTADQVLRLKAVLDDLA